MKKFFQAILDWIVSWKPFPCYECRRRIPFIFLKLRLEEVTRIKDAIDAGVPEEDLPKMKPYCRRCFRRNFGSGE